MTDILENFWVLEGLDGAGTTTQLRLIEKELSSLNIPAFITNEPTDNPSGKLIRRFLSGELPASQSTIAYAFATDRDDHLYNPEYGILKHLEKGEIVVSDRYFFSSIAYQSIGFDLEAVVSINSRFPYPSHVIYVDTPVDTCISRIESRGNGKEIYEKQNYQAKVRENYERCFANLPSGCKLIRIDGTLSIEEIYSIISKEIKNALYSEDH